MVRHVFILLGVFILCAFSCRAQDIPATPQGKCCQSIYPGAWDTLDLDRLGKEYKRLKALKCSDCDRFESDLMMIMEVLGKRLDGSRKGMVRKIMGKPDEKEDGQQIYYWRNRHDYLYFTKVKDSSKVKHGWYYAYE